MRESPLRYGRLVLDATGVGRGIVDLFRDAHKDGLLPSWPVSVTITAGMDANGLHVPKPSTILGDTCARNIPPDCADA